MPDRFVSLGLDEIMIGEDLPGNIYLYIHFRFVTLRGLGDCVDRALYERLEIKKVKSVFVREEDRAKFEVWTKDHTPPPPEEPKTEPERSLRLARMDAHRSAMDIFQGGGLNQPRIVQVIESSKKLVENVMKIPYAVQTLDQLQTFSRGTADHSVNVSVLSVYLAMNMGYSHAVILQHVAMGSLLHDIGKIEIDLPDEISDDEAEERLKQHPTINSAKMEAEASIPKEVKMIVEQHHEAWDGSGYPNRLKGAQIYDLARIVSIANQFDEMVSEIKGTLAERQKRALYKLENELFRKFDPQKLEKVLKILKPGV